MRTLALSSQIKKNRNDFPCTLDISVFIYVHEQLTNKRQRIPKGQSQMGNPEKLATLRTQDEDKQNKSTIQYLLGTTTREQTQIT